MTSRFVACPTRNPGESGRAFVERMLAMLNTKGGATALPTPPKVPNLPKVEIAAKSVKVAEDKATMFWPKTEGPPKVVLDWRGRPDTRPTTKCWPPGPMGPDGRSTHRYVGPWPPKWASKWTTNPKKVQA
jgi:hypothetical protein